jgi:cytochrome c551/c552
MRTFIYEILILLVFWISIHLFCTNFLEPRINTGNVNKNKNITNIDYRDKDDTIPDIILDQKYLDLGKDLFSKKCACCHSFDRDVSGPKLNDSISFKYFNESIKDIGALSKKYKHTSNLFTKWESKFMRMPNFNEDLNEEEIFSLKSYIIYSIKNNTH